jgi:hypothetical protein
MYFILSHLLSSTYRQFRIQKILYFAIKSVNYISKHALKSVKNCILHENKLTITKEMKLDRR